MSVGATAAAIFLGILAAYGLTRFRVRLRRLSFAILAIRMVPGIVLVLPFYLLYRDVGLLDTLFGLGITYLTFALPFAIWMISGFFELIPFEVEEAAALDGASNWMILWRILVPIAAPAILTTAVLTFIFCWNEFLFALILTSQKALTFLPLLLALRAAAGAALRADLRRLDHLPPAAAHRPHPRPPPSVDGLRPRHSEIGAASHADQRKERS